MLVQMELGEEVSLLPTEIGRQEEEGKLADDEEKMKGNGRSGQSNGKWGMMTTAQGNEQRRRTSTTTTTTTMGTPFAGNIY